MKKYWLLKSEPNSYSIRHLAQENNQTTSWDGIRNYQVRNLIRDKIQLYDECFFYHSSCKIPQIVGLVKVVKTAYPDLSALDRNSQYFDKSASKDNPKWLMFDVKLTKILTKTLPLSDMRAIPELQEMQILKKGNRLSITQINNIEWDTINALIK